MKSFPIVLSAVVSFGLVVQAVAGEAPIVPRKVVVAPEKAESGPGESPSTKAGPVAEEGDLVLPSAKTPEATKSIEGFLKLPPEKRKEFGLLLNEGMRLVQARRVQEAAEQLNAAETIWPDHPDLLMNKGAVLVRMKDYERATRYYAKGAALYPDIWSMRFNLAEMDFVRKDFKKAQEGFAAIQSKEKDLKLSESRLIEYKIILCLLMQGKMDEFRKRLDQFDLIDDTPIRYYGMAAFHFHEGEKEKAQEWVKDAHKIYQASTLELYEDSLIELGWLFKL